MIYPRCAAKSTVHFMVKGAEGAMSQTGTSAAESAPRRHADSGQRRSAPSYGARADSAAGAVPTRLPARYRCDADSAASTMPTWLIARRPCSNHSILLGGWNDLRSFLSKSIPSPSAIQSPSK